MSRAERANEPRVFLSSLVREDLSSLKLGHGHGRKSKLSLLFGVSHVVFSLLFGVSLCEACPAMWLDLFFCGCRHSLVNVQDRIFFLI